MIINIRLSSFFLMLVAGVLCSGMGCIKIDATVNFGREGNGSFRAMYGMPSYILKRVEADRQLTRSLDYAAGKPSASSQTELDIPFLYDEVALKSRFKGLSSDEVILEALKTREQGGWRYVDFTLKFSTLESLFKQSFFKDFGVSFMHIDENTCKLVVTLPPVGNTPDAMSMATPESLAKLTPFLNGFRVITRITVPGDIRNSTSLMSDSQRATWEWDFDKDARALERLSHDKIIIVFDAAGIKIRDFEKPAGTTVLSRKSS
ncbi:MAG: hypothetical protein WCO42_04170 [bacterium]